MVRSLTLKKLAIAAVAVGVVGFLIIQVLPMERLHWTLANPGNPPIEQQVAWDSPETEAIMRTACLDCHSNETRYPWYAAVAPVKWLVYHDINKGRAAMNFSEEPIAGMDIDDIVWHMNNDMPPRVYLPTHPDANLSDAQLVQLEAGLRETIRLAGGNGEGDGEGMAGMDMESEPAEAGSDPAAPVATEEVSGG